MLSVAQELQGRNQDTVLGSRARVWGSHLLRVTDVLPDNQIHFRPRQNHISIFWAGSRERPLVSLQSPRNFLKMQDAHKFKDVFI